MHFLIGATTITTPPVYIDLAAVFLGGLSGALFAEQRRVPITGVLALALVTGLGGGIIRDVLLNVTPIALTNPVYLPLVVIAAVIGFYFTSLVKRVQLLITILDPIWMALYAVIGAEKSLDYGLNAWAAILIGVVTGIGGGVLRDILAGEKPEIMLGGPINQLAVIIGSAVYVGLVAGLRVNKPTSELLVIALVFGIRMLALKFGIRAPEPVDLPKQVPAVVRRTLRRRKRAGGNGEGSPPEDTPAGSSEQAGGPIG